VPFRLRSSPVLEDLPPRWTRKISSPRRAKLDFDADLFGPPVEWASVERKSRSLRRVTVVGSTCRAAWTGSWTGVPESPSGTSAVNVMIRAIRAASAHCARARTSCKRQARPGQDRGRPPLERVQRHDHQAHVGKPEGLDWIVDLPAVSATVGAAEKNLREITAGVSWARHGLAPISFPPMDTNIADRFNAWISDPDTLVEPTLQDAFTEGFAQAMEWISGQPRQRD
jgi:hypothetical protein